MSQSAAFLLTIAADAAAPGANVAIYVLSAAVVAVTVGVAIALGRRVRQDARRPVVEAAPPPPEPSELTARHVFRVLQERKIATVEQLAAMSPRERQLLFDAVARKVTPIVGMPAVSDAGAAAAAAAAVTEVPVGVVHCPACGAALPAHAEASSRLLAQCAGCGRRVAARRDGARLSVTVDERRDSASMPSISRPPERPSGGSPATRGRS